MGKRALESKNVPVPAKKSRSSSEAGTSCQDEEEYDCEVIINDLLNKYQTSREKEANAESGEEDEDSIGDNLQSVQLAKLVDKILRKRLSEKQERPGNCENAKATSVNPGIWRKLR
jgi:hypothetical protein